MAASPIIPTNKYITSRAAQISGIKLRKTNVELKKNDFNFYIQVLFGKYFYAEPDISFS